MSVDLERALNAVDEHFDTFIDELREVCKLRSRRSDEPGMLATAEFIRSSIERWGGTATLLPWRDSYPYVMGEFAGGDLRLLNFNHYDVEVEPTGDESEWVVPPFSGELRDGKIFARGVADDKGALMSRIHAAAAWRLSGQVVPTTTRFLIEGKRRLDSPGLESFVREHRDSLAADAALWENSWVDQYDRPLLKLAEKGVLYLRVSVQTMLRDLTSQNTVLLPSATARLIGLLGTLVGPDGFCRFDGLTQGADVPSTAEIGLLRSVPFDDDFLLARAGIDHLRDNVGAADAAVAIRTQPSVTITGIGGGDTSDDVTLNVPAFAWAKIEVRLVAGQSPNKILELIKKQIARAGYSDARVEVLASSAPNRTRYDDSFVTLVAASARDEYGTEPLIEPWTQWIGNQGAIGVIPIVGVGVSRADSSVDGPNEHIRVEDYRSGIRHVVRIMHAFGLGDRHGL